MEQDGWMDLSVHKIIRKTPKQKAESDEPNSASRKLGIMVSRLFVIASETNERTKEVIAFPLAPTGSDERILLCEVDGWMTLARGN